VFQRDTLADWRSVHGQRHAASRSFRRKVDAPTRARAHELLALFGLDG
jgi:hypothetical protein